MSNKQTFDGQGSRNFCRLVEQEIRQLTLHQQPQLSEIHRLAADPAIPDLHCHKREAPNHPKHAVRRKKTSIQCKQHNPKRSETIVT
jgi:hypothetical protein